jgi:hypothetical protein
MTYCLVTGEAKFVIVIDAGESRENCKTSGSNQTGLRRAMRKHPNSHREAKATAPVLDSTRGITHQPGVKELFFVPICDYAWFVNKAKRSTSRTRSGDAVVAEDDFLAAIIFVAAVFAALAVLRRDLILLS